MGQLDASKGKSKGLKVTSELRLKEFEGVWAIGDCAEVPRLDGKGNYGATAQNATREGKQAARNIVKLLHNQPLQPFRYTPIGELALVDAAGASRASITKISAASRLTFCGAWSTLRSCHP